MRSLLQPHELAICCIAVACVGAAPLAAGADATTANAWRLHQRHSAATVSSLERSVSEMGVPNAAAPVLAFSELFAPASDTGLVFSERAKSLAGQRVRLTGFMVRETQRQRGVFLLARNSSANADGTCAVSDALPFAVYVHVGDADATAAVIPFTPAQMTVTGILELGPQREANGRLSVIRLGVVQP